MSVGFIIDGFLFGATPGLAANVPGDHILPQGERGLANGAEKVSGPLTENRPVEILSVAKTGRRAASFLNDWYNRIHVTPRVLDLGAVTGGTTRSATVWNAYLSASPLDGISEVGADALNLTGVTTPRTFKPLEYVVLSVSPEEEGPPTIDTTYTFDFDGRTDFVTLGVVGRRARLWPFEPNWRNAVDVDLEYRTDILAARNGREQRRALRKAPRRQIGFAVTIGQSEMRTFHQVMTRWQSRPWLLADPTRSVACPDGAPSGSTQIAVDALPAWLTEGQTVVLGDATVMAVSSIDADQMLLTLDAELSETVPAGAALRPAVSGLLSGATRARHPSSGATEFNLTFSVDPGSEAEDAASPGIQIHGGREVLALKPNWGESVESEYVWEPEQIDFGFGRIESYNPIAFGTMIRRASYVQQTAEDVAEVQQFFARRRGQAGEFMMPTWLNDLPPKFDLVEGTNFIRVEGTEVAVAYADDPIYQAVAVILHDGRRIYRTLTGLTTVADLDGTDTVLSCDGEWLSDMAVDEIAMISWLPVVRFAADQLTVEWLTNEVAQTSLAMKTLEALDAEDPIPAYDGAGQWLLEVAGLGYLTAFDTLDWIVNHRYPEITT